jgi:hypothetical protein
MSLPVAIITGLVIECLGLVAAYNWQWFSEWNRIKLKSDVGAPATIPIILGGCYLAATIGLVVALEVFPVWATYAPATMPLLAIVGTVNLALIAGQEGREAAAETARQQRKAERAEARKRKSEALTGNGGKRKRKPETVRPADNRQAETGNGNDTRQVAAAILAAMPEITGAELGRQLGKSERLGRMLRSELVAGGNGNGLERG